MLKHDLTEAVEIAFLVAPHEIRQRMLKLRLGYIWVIRNQRCTTRDSSENAETLVAS